MRLKNLFSLFFCCTLILAIQSCSSDSNSSESLSNTVENEAALVVKQEVTPPLENIDVPFQNFSAEGNKETILTLDNGTSVEIPANAFVDESGQAIKEPVQIKYREFHTASEILASGIPMIIQNEDGTEDRMQTAGMFEIKAFAGQNEVQIAESKAIMVNMASAVEGNYDFWYFDPSDGNWEVKGNSDPAVNPQTLIDPDQPPLKKPIAPVGFDENKVALNFNINYSQFPEIKDLKGIVWQYAGDDKEKAPKSNNWIFEEAWSDINLEEGKKEGQYQLTLASHGETYSIPVLASQTGADLENAQAAYQRKMQEYNTLKEMMANKEALRERQLAFTRSFSINNFGIHNYDLLLKRNNDIKILADFDFGSNVPLAMKKMITVYLITGESRSVVYLPHSQWDRFAYDPNLDNRIVAILPGNKIATFSQEDFKKYNDDIQSASGSNYTFKMKVEEQVVKNLADVEEVMMAAG